MGISRKDQGVTAIVFSEALYPICVLISTECHVYVSVNQDTVSWLFYVPISKICFAYEPIFGQLLCVWLV